MRNLLFYLDYRSRSGAQRVMVELANYFAKHGDKVTLACQFQSPEEGYALADEVTEVILPAPSKNKLKRQSDRIKHLCDLCEEIKPDLIISFLIVSNLLILYSVSIILPGFCGSTFGTTLSSKKSGLKSLHKISL